MNSTFELQMPPVLPSGRYLSTTLEKREVIRGNKQYKTANRVKFTARTFRQKFTTALLGLMALIIGFTGVTQHYTTNANAFDPLGIGAWLDNNFCSPESAFLYTGPEPYGGGLTGLTISDGSTAGDTTFYSTAHTAYERYGIMGARWFTYRPSDMAVERTNDILDLDREAGTHRGETFCLDPMSSIGTFMGNLVFDGTKYIVLFTTWLYGSVYQPTFIDTINNAVGQMITGTDDSPGLKDIVYLEFLNIVLIFSALYLGWIGLVKRRSAQAFSSAIWMFCAVMIGSLLLFNPTLLPNLANRIIGQIEIAVLRGTTGVAMGATEGAGMCDAEPRLTEFDDAIPVDGSLDAVAERQQRLALEQDRLTVIRSMECVIWQTFVYTPWATGQYGMPPSEVVDGGVTGIDGETYTVTMGPGREITGNIPLYQLDQQVLDRQEITQDDAAQTNLEKWFTVVSETMYGENNAGDANTAVAASWAGIASPFDRLGVAFLSFFSAIIGLMSIVVISMSILMYSVAMSLLMFVSVIFLLIGAHPGMGRGIALRWAELYVGTVLKRIMASVLLGVLMAFYASILGTDIGFGPSLIAIAALSIATLSYRKTLLDALTNINFGGTHAGIEQSPESFKRTGSAVGQGLMGGGAVLAGGGALAAAKSAKAATIAKSAKDGVKASALKSNLAGLKGASHAVGAGGWKAGKTGFVSGRMSGPSAVYALKSAKSAGDNVVRDYERTQKAAEASAREFEQNKNRKNRKPSPKEIADTARADAKRQKNYANDYRQHGQDAEWRRSFEETYGFEPQNPDEGGTGFRGYGLDPDSHEYRQAVKRQKAEYDRAQAEAEAQAETQYWDARAERGNQYQQDYEKGGQAWRNAFKDTYGMDAPDPAKEGNFYGYGLNTETPEYQAEKDAFDRAQQDRRQREAEAEGAKAEAEAKRQHEAKSQQEQKRRANTRRQQIDAASRASERSAQEAESAAAATERQRRSSAPSPADLPSNPSTRAIPNKIPSELRKSRGQSPTAKRTGITPKRMPKRVETTPSQNTDSVEVDLNAYQNAQMQKIDRNISRVSSALESQQMRQQELEDRLGSARGRERKMVETELAQVKEQVTRIQGNLEKQQQKRDALGNQ